MERNQIELVQESFSWASGDKDALTAKFYDRLFDVAPKTKMLFTSDNAKQHQMLFAVLAMIVKGLNDIDKLSQSLIQLGEQHAHLGVRPEYYPVFGDVLIDTVLETIGKSRDKALRAAWHQAFNDFSCTMQRANKEAGSFLH